MKKEELTDSRGLLKQEYIKFAKNNLHLFDKEPFELQTFITHIYGTEEESMKRHKEEMMGAILFSQFTRHKNFLSPETGEPISTMSGFFEQKGRLPKSMDEIEIIKGKYYMDIIGGQIRSEIGIVILKNE